MKRSRVLTGCLAATVMAASVILGACSGGGGGGAAAPPAATPKLRLSGTIASGGSYTFSKGFSGKMLFGAAVPVSKAVAVPMSRGSLDSRNMGSRVSGNIGSDGKFGMELPTNQDWLLAIVDSGDKFVGSIVISAGSSTILNLPATVSTLSSINLGTVNGTGNDVVSSTTVTASDFSMNAGQFSAFANSDDVFKNVKNIINNYNTTTGVWYQFRPDFTWVGSYAAMDGAFSGTNWAYQSYDFQMDTNATNLTIQDLCSGGTGSFVSVGWTPPANITLVGAPTVTYNTANPIINSNATCTTYQSDGKTAWQAASNDFAHPFYATDAYWGPYGTISYSIPAWFAGSIPVGNWTWNEGGVVKATFDPSVATPVNADGIRPLGYVPSFKLTTVSGVGSPITAVDVEWFYFDEVLNTYVQVVTDADYAVMSHFIERAEIIIESGSGVVPRRHSSFGFDPTVAAERHLVLPASGPDMWTYADMIPGNGFALSDAGSIGVFYSSGGIGRYFWGRAAM